MAAMASPEDIYLEKEMVLIAIQSLSERERNVVCRRAHGETLRSISEDQNVTQERIRQIECNAHRKAKFALTRRGYKEKVDISREREDREYRERASYQYKAFLEATHAQQEASPLSRTIPPTDEQIAYQNKHHHVARPLGYEKYPVHCIMTDNEYAEYLSRAWIVT